MYFFSNFQVRYLETKHLNHILNILLANPKIQNTYVIKFGKLYTKTKILMRKENEMIPKNVFTFPSFFKMKYNPIG